MSASYEPTPRKLTLQRFPTIRATPFLRHEVAACRIRHPIDPSRDDVFDIEPQPAYLLMIYLAPVVHCDLLDDGSVLAPRTYRSGSVCVVDLSEGAAIRLQSSLDAIAVVVPLEVVDEAAGRFPGIPMHIVMRRDCPDPVLHKLALALDQLMEASPASGDGIVRHIFAALTIHLAFGRPSLH